MSYKKQIELHRAGKDDFMKNNPQSPIPPELLDKFNGLEYFPPREDYRFVLPLNEYDNPDIIEMEMSAGGVQKYYRIGYLEFTHPENNKRVKIHVYQSVDHPDYYFVPFRDVTSNNGVTYGAGRYLELEKEGNLFILDFNYAYNPFCAYSDFYTCPLPPIENWLDVEINAGEKAFPLSTH